MKTRPRFSQRISQKIKLKTVVIVGISLFIIGIIATFIFLYLNMGLHEKAHAAPPTNISGIINSYLRVTSINLGTRRFTSDNLSGTINDFQPGKTIMIYQAQGATITTSNSSAYGTTTAYNNAGNYELAIVQSITGTGPYVVRVTSLVNSYTASGNVQLISVPEYVDATVTGTITSVPWSATQGRGGVVAFEVSNVLTLGANVDVSGQGFAGGIIGGSDGSCPDNATYTSASTNFAAKGEGISTDGNLYARGAEANGGGGGNPHNAGGGGGSNFTYGGDGGQGYQPGGACANANAGGIGGKKISYSTLTNKIFLGGGGGAGQQNNGVASSGANGGGVIVIRTKTIKSTCGATYGFLAKGLTAANTAANDGAGGGGAGGSILLDVKNYILTCNITASASGGNGGSVNDAAAHGGGGGAGIGPIIEVTATTDPKAIFASTVGTNGSDCTSCSVPSGGLPETPVSSKMTISGIPGQTITLPIELVSFSGKVENNVVQLEWVTASEMNNDHFTIERSVDATTFIPILEVKAVGNSKQVNNYSATDKMVNAKSVYYRLKQTDYDGKFTYSNIIAIDTHAIVQESFFFPNPASDKLTLINSNDNTVTIRIINSQGVVVITEEVDGSGKEIDVRDWREGVYVIERTDGNQKVMEKLMIRH